MLIDPVLFSRSARESTACSFIRYVNAATPESCTRQKTVNAVNRRTRSAILDNIPSAAEIEEFFAPAEQQQQEFINKYNFDIVNDIPLPGRYKGSIKAEITCYTFDKTIGIALRDGAVQSALDRYHSQNLAN
ncbi:hypothetical protein ACH5RR_010438, partial [Cinchona calisaya]